MQLIKTKSFELATYSQGNPKANKLALVLPGKLDTKDYVHMKSHVNFLANLGFFALSFDPPGTWESRGDISIYNTTNYLKAVDELIEYFGSKETFLIGHSRGASVATIAGSKNPLVVAYCAVMPSITEEGFRSKEKWEKDEIRISYRDIPPGDDSTQKREFRTPYSLFEDQQKYKVTEDIKNCKKAKLVVVGKNDSIVSPDQVRQLFHILSEPKKLYTLNYDHNYRKDRTKIEEVNRAVEKFLKDFGVI